MKNKIILVAALFSTPLLLAQDARPAKSAQELAEVAMKEGDIAQLKKLFATNELNANTPDTSGSTLLMRAAGYQQVSVVNFLIESGANAKLQNENGRTALMYATIDMMKFYSRYMGRTSPDERKQRDKERDGALKKMLKEQEMIIKALHKAGAELEAKDQAGRTALFHAVDDGNTGMVKTLIKLKADVNAQNKDGMSILSLAEDKADGGGTDRTDIVKMLKKAKAKK